MATSRTHLTALPPGFITVRIMQLLFTTTIIALATFAIVVNGGFSEFITLLSAALTLITLIWVTCATYITPKAYNYWAVLAMEIFCFLLWIDAFVFALGASFSQYEDDFTGCNDQYNAATQSYENECTQYSTTQTAAYNAAIAVAALTACNMILFLVSMIVVSVFIARHRDAGGHNKIGSAAPVSRSDQAALMTQTDFELRQQNLALQQQYIHLQQQNLDLQQKAGIVAPPMMAQMPGQQNVSRDPEMGMMRSHEQMSYGQAYSPVNPPVQRFQNVVASGSGQQAEAGKGKERAEQEAEMSGAQGAVTDRGDEITAVPHAL